MNKNTILISCLVLIAAGTSYLAIIKYIEVQKKSKNHEYFIQEKLTLIHDKIEALHKNQQENNNGSQGSNTIIEITTQDDLRAMFKNNNKPSVIFFHMDGCGWCNKMKPVFEQSAQNKKFKNLQFYNVNGRSAQAPIVVKELFDQQISGYPFFLFINENGFVDKQSGFSDQDKFENKIKENFATLV